MTRCGCIFASNALNWMILGGNERWVFKDSFGAKIDTKDWINANLHPIWIDI